MLGVVVVPGDTVVFQERKQSVSVFLKSLLALGRGLALKFKFGKVFEKPIDRPQVLFQEVAFQAVPINAFHHRLHQCCESLREQLEFFVIWVLQDLVVQISNEMDQTLLLGALDAVVSGVEIGHQDTLKILQHVLDGVTLPSLRIEVSDFFHAGEDPNKPYLHLCKITAVEIGKKIAYSWRYDGFEGDSMVTFELFKEEENTKLKLTHAGLESFPTNNPDFAITNFEKGWTFILDNSLKEFLGK